MHIYVGVFLVAFSSLAFEVSLSRLLSVITWYHLAFFAVSTAMLGMTAGAITVYLRPQWFEADKVDDNLAKACLAYALSVPFTVSILCILPLVLKPSIMILVVLLIATAVSSLPFYFAGIVVSAVLTKYTLPIGRLYASDLIGASLGCLFVLGGLRFTDGASFMIFCGSVGALAALSFARDSPNARLRKACVVAFAVLAISGIINTTTMYGIRPFVVKGKLRDPGEQLIDRWNSYSNVVVSRRVLRPPQYWGPSPKAPQANLYQHQMVIDGAASTHVRRFQSTEDIEHLRFDVSNVAYFLRPTGGACVIGVGGGRDIQSAILFGHERVVGIDVNPIFIDLLENQFREFAGLADNEAVTFVVDEARSHLTRSKEKFALIQMSLIDTWAATGAGAFSLSENALYTVEAWHVFLDRLAPNGIFTVSRWHSPTNLGETGRVLSLAVATLLENGIDSPSRHIALVTVNNISSLLISNQPLSKVDIATLKGVAAEMEFEIIVAPGEEGKNEILQEIVSATSMEDLAEIVDDQPLNYSPPTDENPYFFNMLRLSNLPFVLSSNTGVARGNLTATVTLIALILSLLVVSVATIVLPLIVRNQAGVRGERSAPVIWPAALYFALIGSGFMLVEIALIQRLSVFLGHPVYGLGILLFGIVGSSGVGSFFSEQLPLDRKPWVYVYPVVTAVAIIIIRFASSALMSEHISDPISSKILASVALVFPLGLLLGVFFPTGMRLVRAAAGVETPWYWAINGITGVLCSALAVFISIYAGISTNFYLGAACYAALPFCLVAMSRLASDSTDAAAESARSDLPIGG